MVRTFLTLREILYIGWFDERGCAISVVVADVTDGMYG